MRKGRFGMGRGMVARWDTVEMVRCEVSVLGCEWNQC